MRERLKKAEEKLEVCSDEVTKIQAKVRELVLLKDDMDKRKTRLYRKMDWYERLLPIEGIDNDTISNGIAPFTQNLGPKILIKGIKEMWFVGEMNSIDADKLLKGCDNGTFLVRLNNNRNYVLSVVNKRKVRHIRIHENEERHLCWLKTTKQFYSIELLVQFFQENSLGLQDREYTTKLMYPRKVRHIRIHENEERHLCWLKTTKQFYSIELLVQFFQENSLGLQDREYTTKLMYPVYYK
ncbi:hypothetical protein ACHWQZ_G007836 [Mnemiopsis leidyi]